MESKRINVVDSLRGFAVAGIIIIHFLEHLNFYSWPKPSAFEQELWNTVFFLGSSKMYAIFALLFGLTCYIQHHNQETRGYDFRLRFAWRMILLFVWGLIDMAFFNGDILCTYAVLGLLLLPLVKSSNRVLLIVMVILFIQPIEVYYIVMGLFDPSLRPMNTGIGPLWGKLAVPCASGSFLDVVMVNLKYGLQVNFGWAIEHGRLTQTLMLFVAGLLLGRKRLFIDEGNNLEIWKRICVWAVVAFAVLQPLVMYLPDLVENRTVRNSLDIQLTAWRNFVMMAFYVSGITLLYYRTGVRRVIDHFNYVGKMSLTSYLLQSVVGAFLFYNWGLGLYEICSHGYSFLLSIVFLVVLYFFCRYWTTRYRRGPLEELWHRATWIFSTQNKA